MRKLAQCTVEVYARAKQAFSVDDQRHYLFTPRDMTRWAAGLLRYAFGAHLAAATAAANSQAANASGSGGASGSGIQMQQGGGGFVAQLLDAWYNEAMRIFGDKLVDQAAYRKLGNR